MFKKLIISIYVYNNRLKALQHPSMLPAEKLSLLQFLLQNKKRGETKIVSSLVCLWSEVRHVHRHQISCIHNGCLDKENRTAHSGFSHVNNLSTQTGKHKKPSEQNAGHRIWKGNVSSSPSAANYVWTEAQSVEDSLTLDVDGDRGLFAVGRRFVGGTAGDPLAALDVRGGDVERAHRAFSSAISQQRLHENTNTVSTKVSQHFADGQWHFILAQSKRKKYEPNNSRWSVFMLPLECRSKTDFQTCNQLLSVGGLWTNHLPNNPWVSSTKSACV